MHDHLRTFTMLIGPRLSGKTHYFENCEDYANSMYISECPEFESQDERDDCMMQLCAQVQQAVRANQDIIIDRTNLTYASRRIFWSLLPDWYECVAIVFSLPMEVIFSRVSMYNSTAEKPLLRRYINNSILRYEFPDFDEFDRIIHLAY